jgi:hypothetical protein
MSIIVGIKRLKFLQKMIINQRIKIGLVSLFLLASFMLSTLSLSAQRLVADDYVNSIGRGMAMSMHRDQFYPNTLDILKSNNFQHVRVRCKMPDVWADNFTNHKQGFDSIVAKVNKVLDADLIPIVAWSNGEILLNAPQSGLDEFVNWWREIAIRMKAIPNNDKISFNLIIECAGSDRMCNDIDIFNNVIQRAVTAIREVDQTRIIIVPDPTKSGGNLNTIDPDIFGDEYMMAEFHSYAAGPKADGGKRNWTTGNAADKQNVHDVFDPAKAWSDNTGIPLYLGAWMPMGNRDDEHGINQELALSFGNFWLSMHEQYKIPWTMNAIQHFIIEEDTYNQTSMVLTKHFPDDGNELNMVDIWNLVTTYGDFVWTNISTPSVSVNNSSLLSTYPNPTSDLINIAINDTEFTNGTVNIYNSNGALLEKIAIESANESIELNGEAGLYLIEVNYNGNIGIMPVIKE